MIEMDSDQEYFQDNADDMMWYRNVFVLYNAHDFPIFQDAVTGIVPEFFVATNTTNTYSLVASSMESMNRLASLMLVASILTGILILSLILILFLRGRRQEFGIYLALGAKRRNVILQVVLEVLAISLLAIGLSLFAGNLIAETISEGMLVGDLVAAQASNQGVTFSTLDFMGLSNNVSIEDVVASYDTSLTPSMITTFSQ
jgi:putative ABC transport system permease protein